MPSWDAQGNPIPDEPVDAGGVTSWDAEGNPIHEDQPQEGRGFLSHLGSTLKGAASFAGDVAHDVAVTDPVLGLANLIHTGKLPESKVISGLVGGIQQEAGKAGEELAGGHLLSHDGHFGAIGHGIAAAVPGVGPAALHAVETGMQGDLPGAAGEVAGLVGVPLGIEAGAGLAAKGLRGATRELPRAMAEGRISNSLGSADRIATANMRGKDPVGAYIRGVKPSLSRYRELQSLKGSLNETGADIRHTVKGASAAGVTGDIGPAIDVIKNMSQELRARGAIRQAEALETGMLPQLMELRGRGVDTPIDTIQDVKSKDYRARYDTTESPVLNDGRKAVSHALSEVESNAIPGLKDKTLQYGGTVDAIKGVRSVGKPKGWVNEHRYLVGGASLGWMLHNPVFLAAAAALEGLRSAPVQTSLIKGLDALGGGRASENPFMPKPMQGPPGLKTQPPAPVPQVPVGVGQVNAQTPGQPTPNMVAGVLRNPAAMQQAAQAAAMGGQPLTVMPNGTVMPTPRLRGLPPTGAQVPPPTPVTTAPEVWNGQEGGQFQPPQQDLAQPPPAEDLAIRHDPRFNDTHAYLPAEAPNRMENMPGRQGRLGSEATPPKPAQAPSAPQGRTVKYAGRTFHLDEQGTIITPADASLTPSERAALDPAIESELANIEASLTHQESLTAQGKDVFGNVRGKGEVLDSTGREVRTDQGERIKEPNALKDSPLGKVRIRGGGSGLSRIQQMRDALKKPGSALHQAMREAIKGSRSYSDMLDQANPDAPGAEVDPGIGEPSFDPAEFAPPAASASPDLRLSPEVPSSDPMQMPLGSATAMTPELLAQMRARRSVGELLRSLRLR